MFTDLTPGHLAKVGPQQNSGFCSQISTEAPTKLMPSFLPDKVRCGTVLADPLKLVKRIFLKMHESAVD